MKTQFVAVFNMTLITVTRQRVPQSGRSVQSTELHGASKQTSAWQKVPLLSWTKDMFVFLESLAWEGQEASKTDLRD